MKFALYISNTPLTLKQGKGHQTFTSATYVAHHFLHLDLPQSDHTLLKAPLPSYC